MISLDPDLLDLIENNEMLNLIGVFDKNPNCDTGNGAYLGNDSAWPIVQNKYSKLFVALAVDPPKLRVDLANYYGHEYLISIISHDAIISKTASIGKGCILQHGTKVLRNAVIGNACKLNVDTVIHHDCRVGDYCTFSPGARLLGSVSVGDRVSIGSGAIVLPGLKIGHDAVIGAGAVVTRNIEAGSQVVGIPARMTQQS